MKNQILALMVFVAISAGALLHAALARGKFAGLRGSTLEFNGLRISH